VLARGAFFGRGRRYTSKRTLFGLPLEAIASGPHGAERYGAPVGIIALGDKPRGIIAIGGMTFGVVACGGMAVGLLAMGCMGLGLWAFAGLAVVIIDGWGNTINIWPF
jgi:hypothetical protein